MRIVADKQVHPPGMIDFFESSVRINPDGEFFTFIDDDGKEFSYTCWEARLASAALARKLQAAGVRPGETMAIDLPNGPEYVFIMLAAAYVGITMVMLDHGLSESEKLSCMFEIERAGVSVSHKVDSILAAQLMRDVRNLPTDDTGIVTSIYGQSRRNRSIMGEGQDVIDDTVHFAERAAHLFDRDSLAVIMFSGGRREEGDGKRRKLKAVPLTWAQLLDASSVANSCLGAGANRLWQERLPFNSFSASSASRKTETAPSSVWQCVLPIGSIDGLQSVMRSVVGKTPFRLHTGNDAEQVLRDAERNRVTHVAVDDAMLQDLLTVEEWRNDAVPGIPSRLSRYQCVLLTGRTRSPRTVKRAYDLGARVFASYGIPETSGTIAATLIAPDFKGGLQPMDGYEVRIVDQDEEGCGRLALRGPGIFNGYLNSRTAFTVDHMFIADEKASLEGGLIYLQNRSKDMFVSAGQNIYPVEIADVLRHVGGVSGVHVFGVNDSRCGMLPVAIIERSDPTLTPQVVEETTRPWFSTFTVPISIFVFDQLPRNEHGKLDRPAIESIFNS